MEDGKWKMENGKLVVVVVGCAGGLLIQEMLAGAGCFGFHDVPMSLLICVVDVFISFQPDSAAQDFKS